MLNFIEIFFHEHSMIFLASQKDAKIVLFLAYVCIGLQIDRAKIRRAWYVVNQFLKSMFSLDLRNESFEINCKDPDDCVEFTLDTYKNLTE